ncbi:2'-5' RNA ligase family protein [Stappia sp. MMSF_3263]|uniref:2'-5' RNA ligase family protein n=1 Tax=Stappia sp. MMSF_3263 TaxID=3046693 RepID=UPI00273D7E01|nr:2'-5' RNA ligase family protein [Stappia sp. MMSF_3263]
MPLAITLRIDDPDAASVTTIWETLLAGGMEATRRNFAYAPHLTLAILPDAPDEEDAIADTLAGVAGHCAPLALTLSGPGIFPGPPAVVHLAPVPRRELLDLHQDLDATLAARHPGLARAGHYLPGAFVPHVTLCEATEDPAAAIPAVLAGSAWPLRLRASRLELVRFHPARVVAGFAMG